MELDLVVFRSLTGRRLFLQDCPQDRNMNCPRIQLGRKRNWCKRIFLIGIALAVILLWPVHSQAYAGPGAGFAVISSFWTLFVSFLYSVYAFLTWPFRHLFRLLRRRRVPGKAQIQRAVILGFDGMDPVLARRFISQGRLPNLAKLSSQGSFHELRTT